MRYSARTAITTTATTRPVVAMIAAEREPGSGPSSATAGCGMSLIAPLFDDPYRFASRDRGHAHRLASHEPAASGRLGHDLEAARDARRIGHDRRQDRCAAAERDERVAVRAVVAVVTPDAAHGGCPAGAGLAQAPHELDVERRAAARVDGELLPPLAG